MNSVPTILGAMVTHENWAKTDLSSMRLFSIGSTDVPVALIRAVHNRQIPVVQIYGATETAPSAIYQTADIAFETIGSIGRQGCDNAIRLVDLNGGDVPDGEVGEIWVRGKNVLTGYWRDKAATSANLTDGWFHTGDLARRDANGLYWFADRLKHVIISGGENIYPAELERLLTNYTALAEFCVVGRDDERWGQVPVVVAVRREEDVTEIDILRAFEKQVARFKQPKAVIFVEKLPRNALGKILIGEVTRLIA
jgi:fatty-acyl-CoA synthase